MGTRIYPDSQKPMGPTSAPFSPAPWASSPSETSFLAPI
jgi:hypothetical protein